MKTYKDFLRIFIGESDISTLIMVGMKDRNLHLQPLYFGSDGRYTAYIVTEPIEIPSYYEKIATFDTWLKIYDDETCIFQTQAKVINVYRAGELGCIIEVID